MGTNIQSVYFYRVVVDLQVLLMLISHNHHQIDHPIRIHISYIPVDQCLLKSVVSGRCKCAILLPFDEGNRINMKQQYILHTIPINVCQQQLMRERKGNIAERLGSISGRVTKHKCMKGALCHIEQMGNILNGDNTKQPTINFRQVKLYLSKLECFLHNIPQDMVMNDRQLCFIHHHHHHIYHTIRVYICYHHFMQVMVHDCVCLLVEEVLGGFPQVQDEGML